MQNVAAIGRWSSEITRGKKEKTTAKLKTAPQAIVSARTNNTNNNNSRRSRRRLPVCVPHQCHCGSLVNAHEVHSFICKKAPRHTAKHRALNDFRVCPFFLPAFQLTRYPVQYPCSFAMSYLDAAANNPESAAESAESAKLPNMLTL